MTEQNLPPQPPSLEKTPVTQPNAANIPSQNSAVNIPTDDYGNPLPQLLATPRRCKAGTGVSWLTKALVMFKAEPLLWIGMFVAMIAIFLVVGFIPIVGQLLGLLGFVFIGGIIKGGAVQAQGGELRFDHLFAGFKTHFVSLLLLLVFYMVASFVAILVFIIPVALILGVLGSDFASLSIIEDLSVFVLILLFLLLFVLFFAIAMSIWFAPALIVLHDMSVIKAMKKSIKGCLKNILPILVYYLVLILLVPIFVIFTLGLGLLVAIPVITLTYYTSYRDVWTDQPLSGS